MFTPPEKYISHLFIKEVLFATDGDDYRDPQVVKMQGKQKCGCSTPTDAFATAKCLHLRLGENHISEGKKHCKTRAPVAR